MDNEQDGAHSEITIGGGGNFVRIQNAPSLRDVIEKNQVWEKVFNGITMMPEAQGIMVDNAMEHFQAVVADTIRKLDIAGYDSDRIAEVTQLSGECINNTINVLFRMEQAMAKEKDRGG